MMENSKMGTNCEDFAETRDSKEEFSDLITFEGGKSVNSDSLGDALLSDPNQCRMCGNSLVVPRMLYCLHGFCEECLDKKLVSEGGDAGTPDTSIICPTCHHNSKVGTKKLNALPLDVTKTNISDVSSSTILHCTSCTAKEVAKSRCNTCHNLLCSNCDTAHHYMRCFESHKVVSLEEMKKEGMKITIHTPLVCEIHKGENIIFYCNTCLVTACSECLKSEHKPPTHICEPILDSELKVRQEIQCLLDESKAKVEVLLQASNGLNNSLEELAHQHSTAKDLINESYQSYKAVLEKCRDEALENLKSLHRERELKIMMENDRVGKTIENFDDACKFTSHLLEDATATELMYLRKVVVNRLTDLNKSSPKLGKVYSIEFQTDFNNFERVIKENFGKFLTENNDNSSKQSSPLPMIPQGLPPLTINGLNTASGLSNGCTTSLSNSSPISLPMSMQSSFDGDLSNNLQNFTITQSPPLPPPVNTASLQGFSSIAEYNLTQLATLAETSTSNNTSPSPQFSLVELLNNDTACKNLASLAKLGLNNDTVPNGNLLVRSTSTASLNLSNNMMNGFGGVSTSTSPLLSTPDDIVTDPLASILPSTSNNSSTTITRSNKVSPMQIRWKFGQLGPSKSQFNSPHGFCLGLEEDIIVADTNNHRIQVFEKSGQFKFQFGIPGKEEGQLWYPRKVAVMRSSGKYVVCDRGNERSRMQIFTKSGHFLKKIAIRYIDIVAGLAVSSNGEIVAVDSVSPTVFIIGESGELLRWFDCSDYMREPSDIAIHGKEFYVCDFKGHNVVVFNETGQYLRRIGCEGVTNFPNGIDISDAGDVLIGDSHGNRFHVAVFSRDGSLVSEFECPYVKVSRCCGLKITSEGYVVTLAKNNHHVLVLNTLYIM
ncbi:brain tumor protein-like isoform X1 [Coccinella septempunctata]|uniref:brain tumor protein-like isoform X1 n=1 Tax=Coccinella septempunctata TaxID=41139 RepID=UPI001D07FCB6|nr:brain tumor protein-like isoform X1 [Coccinella septempunctata]XP_044747870.1 brain tumor protein-like isoform X1 [Coccinella septempunctata]XP_044747871.1 brain tumor protein-like isoform X1 [Coccinella septempunctata]XP_044747872.1 brain tumor protein-like isoform X1 [Coccinella septempunctata]XP_044747873.1 brain tumor protein-like isoform X1 [Coccinella septempunctata]XP_044747874.1 brain tumor protein-like isoform X1 [Coccinella septempunctata]